MAARRAPLELLGAKSIPDLFPTTAIAGRRTPALTTQQQRRLFQRSSASQPRTPYQTREIASVQRQATRAMSSSSTTTPAAAAPALNPEALTGFADGASYDAHRPSYPAAAVEKLLSAVGIAGQAKARVLDLAAGTGKFTELLAARPEGFEIVAVEPHDDMRRQLERKGLPNVEVKKGFATSIPLSDGSVDAVICAQAFHWFATPPSLTEIARVLTPTGCLGLCWNIEDYNQAAAHGSTTPWERTMRDQLFELDARHGFEQTRFRHERWRGVFASATTDGAADHGGSGGSGGSGGGPFGALQQDEVRWAPVFLGEGELWKRMLTLSCVGVLKGEEMARVERVFADAVGGEGTQRDGQGRIAVHGVTVLAWAGKKP